MAITGETREVIALGILGRYRRSGGTAHIDSLVEWAYRTYSYVPTATRTALRGIAAQVQASYQFGQTQQDQPTLLPRVKDIPVNPTIGPGEPRYRYRVVVTMVGTTTGEQFETAIDIESDTPLTGDQIAGEAWQRASNRQFQRQYRTAVNAVGDQFAFEWHIILAGQRGR